MSLAHAEIRSLAWSQLFPGLLLLRVFRQAMTVRALVLALAGALVMTAGFQVIGLLLSGSSDPALRSADGHPGSLRTFVEAWPWQRAGANYSLVPGPESPAPDWGLARNAHGLQLWSLAGELLDWRWSWTKSAYLLFCILWAVAVWGLFGGAITRLAALGLGRNEQIEMKSAVRYAASRWSSYFASPTFPLLGVLFIALPMALAAWILHWTPTLLALAWPLWLVGGLLIALLALGVWLTWPLMWGAVSCEGTDSFDALGRAYGYLFNQPLRYLGYSIAAMLLGTLGGFVVTAIVAALVNATLWGASWGAGVETLQALQSGDDWSACIFRFWTHVVRLLPTAFGYSFFWTAAVAVYLLLRRVEDEAPLDEIFLDEPQPPRDLPPLRSLTTDAASSPPAAESPAAAPADPPPG